MLCKHMVNVHSHDLQHLHAVGRFFWITTRAILPNFQIRIILEHPSKGWKKLQIHFEAIKLPAGKSQSGLYSSERNSLHP